MSIEYNSQGRSKSGQVIIKARALLQGYLTPLILDGVVCAASFAYPLMLCCLKFCCNLDDVLVEQQACWHRCKTSQHKNIINEYFGYY